MKLGNRKEVLHKLVEYGPAAGLFALSQIIYFDRMIEAIQETQRPIDQWLSVAIIGLSLGAAISLVEYGIQRIATYEFNLRKENKNSNSVQ